MRQRWHWALAIVICGAIGAAAKGYTLTASTDPTPPMAQDVVMLDRRINMLEQRFYSIESRMNRLEQQMSMLQRVVPTPTPIPTPTRDPETDLLRSETATLKARVGELECGILRLDERTLSVGAKETRRRAGGQPKDPCRVNPDVPVKLSARQ